MKSMRGGALPFALAITRKRRVEVRIKKEQGR